MDESLKILNDLPVFTLGEACLSCGTPRDQAIPCNIDKDGNITDCHLCPKGNNN